MADDNTLAFGINFQVNEGKEKALKDWEKAEKDMTKRFSKPMKLDIRVPNEPLSKIDTYKSALSSLSVKFSELAAKKQLIGTDGKLTQEAQALVNQYNTINGLVGQYAVSLKSVVTQQRKQLEAEVAILNRKKQLESLLSTEQNTIAGIKAQLKAISELKSHKVIDSSDYNALLRKQAILEDRLAKQRELEKSITAERRKREREAIKEKEAEAAIFKKKQETAALLSTEQNTIAGIKAQLTAISELKSHKVIDSDDYNKLLKQQSVLEDKLAKQRELEKAITAERRKREREAAKELARKNKELKILRAEENTIENIRKKISLLTAKGQTQIIGSGQFKQTEKEISRLKASLDSVDASRKRNNISSARSNDLHAKKNILLRNQTGLLNGLNQSLNAYVSVLGLTRLVSKIREVTAEFEIQRVALSAIIQDKAAADAIFYQIQEEALKSPFQIKDLISYTKQLSAYRVETENLFATTQKLADVSAGLGVDMSRLVLAYGQVKAASVLRGQELRQFTEAGIPLVQLLADKFSLLRGEVVSTGDVFQLISERAVSFRMVEEIFNDMTEAGGSFYRMQEIQAETLKGMWSNLRDAYDKAFYGIGQEMEGTMKGFIRVLMSVADNWETVVSVSISAVVGITAYRMATLLTNKVLTAQIGVMGKKALADQQEYVNTLKKAQAYRTLTTHELRMVATTKKRLVLSSAIVAATKAERAEDILLLYAQKKLGKARATALLHNKGFNAGLLDGTRRLGYFRIAANTARLSVVRFGKSLLTGKAFLLGATLAIGAMVSAYQKAKEKTEEFEAIFKSSAKAVDGYAVQMELAYDKIAKAIESGTAPEASDMAIKSAVTAIEQIVAKNKELKPLVEDRLKDIDDEAKKLAVILGIYKNIKEALEDSGEAAAVIQSSLEATQTKGFFGKGKDSLINEAAELQEKINDISQEMSEFIDTTSGVEAVKFTKLYQEFTKVRNEFNAGEAGIEDIIAVVAKYKEAISGAFLVSGGETLGGGLTEGVQTINSALIDLQNIWKKNEKSAETFFSELESGFKKFEGFEGLNFKAEDFGLSEDEAVKFEALLRTSLTQVINSLGDDVRGAAPIMEAFIEQFLGFSRNTSEAEEQLSKLERAVNDFIETDNLELNKIEVGDFEGDKALFANYKNELEELKNETARLQQGIANGNKLYTQSAVNENEKQIASLQKLLKFLGIYEAAKTKDNTEKIRKANQQQLLVEVSAVKEAYKEYENLSKVMSSQQAADKVKELYKEVFADFEKLKDINPALSLEDLNTILKEALKTGQAYLDSKGRLKISLDVSGNDVDSAVEDVKDRLQEIASDIKITKSASDLFEKTLGLTGDVALSKQITASITGVDVDDADIGGMLKEQLEASLAGQQIDLPTNIIGNVEEVRGALKSLPEDVRKQAEKSLELLLKYEEDTTASIYKTLGGYESFEKQKEVLAQKTINTIAKINASGRAKEEKERLIALAKAKEDQESQEIDFKAFKETEIWTKTFEDFSRISIIELRKISEALIENQAAWSDLSPESVQVLMDKIREMREEMEKRDPFGRLKVAVEGLGLAFSSLNKNKKEIKENDKLIKQAKLMGEATDELESKQKELNERHEDFKSIVSESIKSLAKALEGAQKYVKAFQSDFNNLSNDWKTLTGDTDSDFALGLQALADGFGMIASAVGIAVTMVALFDKVMEAALLSNPVGWLVLIAAAIASVVKAVTSIKDKKITKDIEALESSIEALEYAAGRLEAQLDKTFGNDRIASVRDLNANLQNQIKLNKKIIAKEKERRGFWGQDKSDQDKIKDLQYENLALQDEILENQQELTDYFAGAAIADSAESFADAWLEARLSFGDTAAALEDQMNAMIKNMVVQAGLAQIAQRLLHPFYETIEDGLDDGDFSADDIRKSVSVLSNSLGPMNESMGAFANELESVIGNLQSGATNLTGISKAVGSLSEDTALQLGAYLQNQLYATLVIKDSVVAIAAELASKTEAAESFSGITYAQMSELSASQLAKMDEIKNDTALINKNTGDLVNLLSLVISVKGASSPKVINTKLS